MKTAPAPLVAYLAGLTGDAKCWRADLFTLTLSGGALYRWTTHGADISYLGQTYLSAGGSSAPLISRGSYRQSVGLSVDTLDVVLGGTFRIGGLTLISLAQRGWFDYARMKIDHMIGAYPGDTSLGAIDSWFEGPVSEVKISGLDVQVRLKSQMELMNIKLPKFTLQPQCGNVIYDTNCTIVKATWTIAGTVATAPDLNKITTATAAILAKADNYFNLGVLAFTSGALSGLTRPVSDFTYSTGTINFAIPLPSLPSAADTFTIYPGCDRSRATCLGRFSNLAHWRGYPGIPKPEAGA